MKDKTERIEIKDPNEGRLHLEMEDGKPVLKNRVNGAEITLHFSEEEPPRNCKEAVLSILTHQYEEGMMKEGKK